MSAALHLKFRGSARAHLRAVVPLAPVLVLPEALLLFLTIVTAAEPTAPLPELEPES